MNYRDLKMNQHYKFVNPPLPYEYDALEPFIDAKTMELHHDRHLQTYVDNLNKILTDYPEYQNLTLEELILFAGSLPSEIKQSVLNNAGGVYNHIFFFSTMNFPSDSPLPANLLKTVDSNFGNFDNFKFEFTKAALSVFGSGYAWLVKDSFDNLKIITTANQDTPLSLHLSPVLAIDVWEHAYYLKNYNKRADYIMNWFHVVDWEKVNDISSNTNLNSFFCARLK